ncbi:hypothetical protein A9Q77_03480 [Marinomonas sp. 42_23_T18]|nr:hypothetical protein A9Q77_03480 [Marinomonas sp. 42_23_T18]
MQSLKICFIFISLIFSSASFSLELPSTRTLLTVSGLISNTNQDSNALFDRYMLDQLPRVSITTHTPWNEGKHTYTGFKAKEFFKLLGVEGESLSLIALNDYMIDIPIQDFTEVGAIFATHMDGVPMTVRNKGPIMIIYPFDDKPELKNESYYGKSIWQINQIVINQ